MTTIEETQQHAATTLLRLVDQRVRTIAVNPPFELADIAVDAQAELARLVTQAAIREAAEDVLIERLANPPSPRAPHQATIKPPP
ncbi:hypothetical protein LCGC14_1469930 [marine sediment metagenome]|uniref:Uncharacterized protein n=1 Tax=marine sediment metagenome TaxID=412755 RepID=A0A0F9JYK5_9ZZZZ